MYCTAPLNTKYRLCCMLKNRHANLDRPGGSHGITQPPSRGKHSKRHMTKKKMREVLLLLYSVRMAQFSFACMGCSAEVPSISCKRQSQQNPAAVARCGEIDIPSKAPKLDKTTAVVGLHRSLGLYYCITATVLQQIDHRSAKEPHKPQTSKPVLDTQNKYSCNPTNTEVLNLNLIG